MEAYGLDSAYFLKYFAGINTQLRKLLYKLLEKMDKNVLF